MMKKLTVLLCTLALMMSCACALAESTVYELPELEMTLTLPDTMLVLTKDTGESVFTLLGTDKNTLLEAMQAQNTYMLIYPSDENLEVNVVMTENKLENLDGIDDASMGTLGGMLKQMLENEGTTVESYDVYENATDKYFRHMYSASPDGVNVNYMIQYYTIRNHKGIVLRMFSYEGKPLTEEQQALMQQIVDGAAYN